MADDIYDPSLNPEPFDLSAMMPQQAASSAPAAPQAPAGNGKKKSRFADIALAALMPLAAKSGGQTAITGLLRGMQRAQMDSEHQAQQQFQNDRLTASDQRAVQSQQDQETYRQQAIQQHQRDQAASIVKDFTSKLAAASSKEEIDSLSQGFRYAAQVVGIRPEAVEGLITKTAPTTPAIIEKQVRKVVGGLTPEQVDQYLQGGMSITVPGQQLPVPVDVWSKYVVAGVDPVTGKRTVSVKKPDVPNTPEEQFYQQFAVEHGAKSFGALPTTAQAQARKTWMQADDRTPKGPDPLLNEIRQLRLDQMRNSGGALNLSPSQMTSIRAMSDDFEKASKDYLTRVQAFQTIDAGAKSPSAAGDLAMIFSFMKMLDPASTVREGEFANAQNAAGIPDRVRNQWNKLLSGERLNPQQRGDFLGQARSQLDQSRVRQRGIMQIYTQRATDLGLPPNQVVIDYDKVFGVTDAPPRAASGNTAPGKNPYRGN